MRVRHANGTDRCAKCAELLLQACSEMQKWFLEVVRPEFPDAHISCAWRGREEQNRYLKMGKSERPWPTSKHNAVEPGSGKPASRALDLFRLSADETQAEFPAHYYRAISATSLAARARIRWGGDWDGDGDETDQKLHDRVHFEIDDRPVH